VTATLPAPAATEPAGRVLALRQRLAAAAAALHLDTSTSADPEIAASQLYGRLVDFVHGQRTTDGLWLLLTAMTGAFPQSDDMRSAMRARDLARPGDLAMWLLEDGFAIAGANGSLDLEMDVVASTVVVDVDFSARHDLHTGIQRVVREVVPRWSRDRTFTLVAWTEPNGSMRHLLPHERDRVLRWNDRAVPDEPERARRRHRLVVPWRSTVVLPENPKPEHCSALASMAQFSGNRTALIGYDCIPAISPELIHEGLPDRFMRYLEAVKHAHRVAGISASATREFESFVDMLPAQGLRGPSVVECALPVEVPPSEPVSRAGTPLVVSVGSFEPRKNQLAVLHAAEQLWREGLDFRLEFIGGGGWATDFDAMMMRLAAAGRPARRRMAIDDHELWRTIRSARFTVFVSLHEGFGLPVAESLACGTPCLTSDHGSTREIADGGGALTVDPMDDRAIADQMRRLLTDDDLVAELRTAALRRPPRTWDDYAGELWEALVGSLDHPSEGAR
jgi:glycosyltransferase involved in cell wall biosynthesis